MLRELLSSDQVLLSCFFRIGLQVSLPTVLASALFAYFLVMAYEESSSFLWWFMFWTFVPSVNIWGGYKDFLCPYDAMSDAWIFENGFCWRTVPEEG